MKELSVGDFKSKFSDVLANVSQGEEITISYGKQRKKVAVIVPYSKYIKDHPRQLGLMEGKASYKLKSDFKITDEEFLNS